jgi:HEAT repeat protein
MKKSVILLASLLVIAFAIPAASEESVLPPTANKALIEDNLLVGMATDNPGLQRSCVLMLGKIQSTRAVVPLMDILHHKTNNNLRVAAAWALCKIGDARGVYAVKMAVTYDENTKVQATCAWYYETLVKQGTFSFVQPETPVIAAAK